MAEPITWRNIGGPNFGGVAQQGNTGVQTLNQGFNALGGTVSKLQEAAALQAQKERELNTAKLIQEMQGAKTIDEFNANKGNFDIAALEQRLGAGKFDAAALVAAQPGIQKNILDRQQLGNKLQQETLAMEAQPVIATLQGEFAAAKNDAELGAIAAKYSNHPNAAVRAAAAEQLNMGQKEVKDFTTADLNNQARQLDINRIKQEEQLKTEASAFSSSLYADLDNGNIGPSDFQKAVAAKAAQARSPAEAAMYNNLAVQGERFQKAQSDFGTVGLAKEGLIAQNTAKIERTINNTFDKPLAEYEIQAKNYDYIDKGERLSANSDIGGVLRGIVKEQKALDPSLDADDALENLSAGYNAWAAKQKNPIQLSSVAAALSNITSSENDYVYDIASPGTIEDLLTTMAPKAESDRQEYQGIKAEQTRLAQEKLNYQSRINGIKAAADDAKARWLASPEGKSADDKTKNNWISQHTDATIKALDALGENIDTYSGSFALKKDTIKQEDALNNTVKDLGSLEKQLAQEIEQANKLRSGELDRLNSFGGPNVNNKNNRTAAQTEINALNQKRIELLNKQAAQKQLLKELQNKAK